MVLAVDRSKWSVEERFESALREQRGRASRLHAARGVQSALVVIRLAGCEGSDREWTSHKIYLLQRLCKGML